MAHTRIVFLSNLILVYASDCFSASSRKNSDLVSLVGGSSPEEGNVYAKNLVTGVYVPVCDDLWDLQDANVVCRQLGYSRALKVHLGSTFGSVSGTFSFDEVDCSGSEALFSNCPHKSSADCGKYEGAGVTCQTENVHAVNLLGGSVPNEGNVFAHNPVLNKYGPVCDTNWDIKDANVVCRQLGYDSAKSYYTGSHYGEVTNVFSYDNVQCSGIEPSLEACPHSNNNNTCGPNDAAGVRCSTDLHDMVNLFGGSNKNEGNVYALNPVTGVYGPVCDDRWDEKAAIVTCRQLSYPRLVQVLKRSYFGPVSGNFSFDHIICTGTEPHLSECFHQNFEARHCSPSEGAGVIC